MTKRILAPLALAGVLALSACGSNTLSLAEAAITASQAALTALEADGKLSAESQTIAGDVLAGLRGLVATTETAQASGATTEATTIADLNTAVAAVSADLPGNATVTSAARQAKTLLTGLAANTSASAKTQAEAAVGVLLVDYLAAQGGTAANSDTSKAAIDAATAAVAALAAGA